MKTDPKRLFTILACLGHGANDTYWFVLPVILPLVLQQFGLRYSGGGGILTAYLITVALCSMAMGKLSDYFPRRFFIIGGFFLASAGLIAAAWARTVFPFVAFVFVAAIGVSTYHPVAYALINDIILEKRGRVFARFEFTGLATLLCVMFVSGLLMRTAGWRAVLAAATVPGIGVGLLFIVYSRRLPAPPTTHSVASDGAEKVRTPFSILSLFFLAISLRQLSVAAALNFAPTYLVDAMGLSPTFATYITACYFAGGMVITHFMGRIIDRRHPLPIIMTSTLTMAPVIFAISLKTPVWLAASVFLVFGGIASAAMPTQNLILTAMTGGTRRGQAFGLLMGITTITASISPGLFGVLADGIGLQATMRLFSLPVLASGLVLFALRSRISRWID